MNRRAPIVGVGCGVTAFALVAGIIITVIQVDLVAGILGVLAGGMAGALTLVAVTFQYRRFRPRQHWLAEGAAGLGYALVVFGAVTYLDVPVVGRLGTTIVVAICLIVGALAGVAAWRRDRSARSA